VLAEGTLLKKEVDLAQASLPALLAEMERKGVNGYVAVTCQGANGLEEGALLFDSGKCVGSVYEYLRSRKKVQGKPAFVRVVNATAAKAAFADLVELKQGEVRDFLAHNENAVYAPSRQELEQAHATKFSDAFEEQVASLASEETPDALLKKYKLSEVLAGFKKPAEKPAERQAEEDGRITPPSMEQTQAKSAEAAKPKQEEQRQKAPLAPAAQAQETTREKPKAAEPTQAKPEAKATQPKPAEPTQAKPEAKATQPKPAEPTQAKPEAKATQPKPAEKMQAQPAAKEKESERFKELVLGGEEPDEGEIKVAKKAGKDEGEEMLELLSLPQPEKKKPEGRLNK